MELSPLHQWIVCGLLYQQGGIHHPPSIPSLDTRFPDSDTGLRPIRLSPSDIFLDRKRDKLSMFSTDLTVDRCLLTITASVSTSAVSFRYPGCLRTNVSFIVLYFSSPVISRLPVRGFPQTSCYGCGEAKKLSPHLSEEAHTFVTLCLAALPCHFSAPMTIHKPFMTISSCDTLRAQLLHVILNKTAAANRKSHLSCQIIKPKGTLQRHPPLLLRASLTHLIQHNLGK
ncbi:hypothetical protein B0T09DRAFT_73883 [Sordaria sp. MPI-SDFR-AT-0083]|nr:hypothetical protein B0T09DRAFT_73883 [Sordaria sp. MPI-SDFR-AT-0083]